MEYSHMLVQGSGGGPGGDGGEVGVQSVQLPQTVLLSWLALFVAAKQGQR